MGSDCQASHALSATAGSDDTLDRMQYLESMFSRLVGFILNCFLTSQREKAQLKMGQIESPHAEHERHCGKFQVCHQCPHQDTRCTCHMLKQDKPCTRIDERTTA